VNVIWMFVLRWTFFSLLLLGEDCMILFCVLLLLCEGFYYVM